MRASLLAVGDRQPRWVDEACEEYARRLRPSLPLEVIELPTAPRGKNADIARARASEARALQGAMAGRGHVVALDERGRLRSSVELAQWLEKRRQMGDDLCFVIGGPDGLADDVLQRAGERWSLSPLTLPHGLARVLVIEQLYRAASVLAGHPYHRA